MSKHKASQLQYDGFIKSHFLWFGNDIKKLEQFKTEKTNTLAIDFFNEKKLRLGKWVERLVNFEINHFDDTIIIAENIQVQQGNKTLGELDCILIRNEQPIHLEIVYKFYLYDSGAGTAEIEKWIGPNRRDSFIEKLNKLIEKQLPLLHHPQTEVYLNELGLSSKSIAQQVYFKAQLFVPLKKFGEKFSVINTNCIVGFYVHQNELEQFKSCKFFIPKKHDWLIVPHTDVNWLNFEEFKPKIGAFLKQQNAPLCWLKKKNGELFKLFVVWW